MKLYYTKSILVVTALIIATPITAIASTDCNVNGCDSWRAASTYDLTNSQDGYGINSRDGQGVYDSSVDPTGSTVVVNGVSISVTAWSDTAGSDDNTVESASLSGPYGEGLGIENADEQSFDSHSHSHSIDNEGHSYRWENGGWRETGFIPDYDMVLFSFSEEVQLNGAAFSWLGAHSSSQQVTVAGLSDVSQLTSGSASWSDIASSVGTALKGSFGITGSYGNYHSDFTTTGFSKYWLVGAYNSIFAYVDGFSQGDDKFKLSSIGFSKAQGSTNDDNADPVSAPGTLALMLLAGGFAVWQRKSKQLGA
ncbi:exosortase-dependent surface protein XDP1 [Alteromonas gilva]|uniref:PEP-CTERM sorting domain-containing protein n=1 Tax=Alteromonas gilva TaxID=2987522 RepID=A0ABT5L8B9_9ALTE|nr:exosortase-dependent surface protein XDP1 [Alteromonas gilva]MDC8832796.1 hypothetical protein [Alteromonas gilva]